jgi:hypothetical protein
MAAWNAGYVTDTDYIYGFYRDLAPSSLGFAHFLSGLRGPDMNGSLAYCELGCGQGFSVNLLGAANPHIQFHATDFLPGHIINAKALAAEAGLTNVHFYDQAFDAFVDEPALPQFDIIVMHGIFSWVDAAARRALLDFLTRKLKLGGIVFLSYDALPGLAAEMPLQRLLTMAQTHGTSSQRVEAGIDLVQKLKAMRVPFFVMNPSATIRFDGMSKSPHAIAHEYFNGTFKPWYHADVAQELSEAKLTFSASCALLQEAHDIYLTREQRQLLAEAPAEQRQTLLDVMYNRMFRRDLFVKGAVPLPNLSFDEMWDSQRFALVTPRDDVPVLSASSTRSPVKLPAQIYEPLLNAFADGPRTLGSITDPAIRTMDKATLRQAIIILNGLFHLCPCLNEAGDQNRRTSTDAINKAILQRATSSAELTHLASPVTGSAHPVSDVHQLFLLSETREAEKAAAFTWHHLQRLGRAMARDGEALQGSEANLAELEQQYHRFESHECPMLEQLGIA